MVRYSTEMQNYVSCSCLSRPAIGLCVGLPLWLLVQVIVLMTQTCICDNPAPVFACGVWARHFNGGTCKS